MKIRNILPILVCTTCAVAMTACSSSVNNNADPSDTAAPATNVEVDDGGCTENHDQIAKLQSDLSKNLYGIAAAESGKEERTNPNPIPESDPIKITFSVEGLSHPFLVKQKQLAEETGKRLGAQVNVISANDDVNQQFNDIQTAIAQIGRAHV